MPEGKKMKDANYCNKRLGSMGCDFPQMEVKVGQCSVAIQMAILLALPVSM